MEKKDYSGMTLSELAEELAAAKDELERAAEIKTEFQKRYDFLREVVIPERMEDENVDGLRVTGIGRLGLTSDMRVQVLASDRQDLHEWMGGHGFGDIVSETINASTLKAWCKERLKRGEEIPPMVKVIPYTRASITKG